MKTILIAEKDNAKFGSLREAIQEMLEGSGSEFQCEIVRWRHLTTVSEEIERWETVPTVIVAHQRMFHFDNYYLPGFFEDLFEALFNREKPTLFLLGETNFQINVDLFKDRYAGAIFSVDESELANALCVFLSRLVAKERKEVTQSQAG